jgi:hypothetical protein
MAQALGMEMPISGRQTQTQAKVAAFDRYFVRTSSLNAPFSTPSGAETPMTTL